MDTSRDQNSAAKTSPANSGETETFVIVTQKNGMDAKEVEVRVTDRAKRPSPGHFGRIEPSNTDEILRPLFPMTEA